MSEFCKLHVSEVHGQILAKLDTNADGLPEVGFYVQPNDLGLCSVAVSFTDDDRGWELAEAALEKSDLAFCLRQLEPMLKMVAEARSKGRDLREKEG